MEAIKDANSEVMKMDILNIWVCSFLTEDEALAWVQEASPAGTTNNWQKTEKEHQRPVKCSDGGGKTHYQFQC